MPLVSFRHLGPRIVRIRLGPWVWERTLSKGSGPVSIQFVDRTKPVLIPLCGEDGDGHKTSLIGPLEVSSDNPSVATAEPHGTSGVVLTFTGMGSANITVDDKGDPGVSIVLAVVNNPGATKRIVAGEPVDFVEPEANGAAAPSGKSAATEGTATEAPASH